MADLDLVFARRQFLVFHGRGAHEAAVYDHFGERRGCRHREQGFESGQAGGVLLRGLIGGVVVSIRGRIGIVGRVGMMIRDGNFRMVGMRVGMDLFFRLVLGNGLRGNS